MKIALCLIATGKYGRFVRPLIDAAEDLFLPGHERTFVLFSDQSFEDSRIVTQHVEHIRWPGPTLYRYHYMLCQRELLLAHDYVYYLDVDMRIVRAVGDEVLGDLVATIHPGFCESPRWTFTYESRIDSRACVAPWEGARYYAGAFQGGRSRRFVAAMEHMATAIDDDARRCVTAVWHDESHWNRYCIDYPPTLSLSHEYCCPEQWRPDTQKIVIVGKNNGEMHS